MIVGTVGVTGVLLLTQPWVFLPHTQIVISLPFAPEDDAFTQMIPMGEIEEWHNAATGLPNGHPGIDFQWNKETQILAVAAGPIMNIRKNEEGEFIVEQSLGLFYRTTYQELNTVEPGLGVGTNLKKGQLIGTSGYHQVNFDRPPALSDPSIQMHWDFASSSMLVDRLCPLGYFDDESKKRIEAIWARVKASGQYKTEYPEICNGYYQDREY